MIYTILYRSPDANPLDRPKSARVKATNATRAIAMLVNEKKNAGEIGGKADIVILEVRITA